MCDLKKEVGQRIRERRKQLNLKKETLVEYADITDGFLGLIERGKRGTTLPHLIKIAELLGVSMDYLILGRETQFDKEDAYIRRLSQLNIDEKEFLMWISILLRKETLSELATVQQLVSLYVDYANKKSRKESHSQ